jgi:hypothetical protein
MGINVDGWIGGWMTGGFVRRPATGSVPSHSPFRSRSHITYIYTHTPLYIINIRCYPLAPPRVQELSSCSRRWTSTRRTSWRLGTRRMILRCEYYVFIYVYVYMCVMCVCVCWLAHVLAIEDAENDIEVRWMNVYVGGCMNGIGAPPSFNTHIYVRTKIHTPHRCSSSRACLWRWATRPRTSRRWPSEFMYICVYI